MRVEVMFPSENLRTADLNGQDVTLHISSVRMDSLKTDRGVERKWFVSFLEMEERHRRDRKKENKRWVLNPTNAKTIAKMHGSEADEWRGKAVTLYPTTCSAWGEDDVPCIRVRPTIPEPRQSAPADTLSDEERAAIERDESAQSQ